MRARRVYDHNPAPCKQISAPIKPAAHIYLLASYQCKYGLELHAEARSYGRFRPVAFIPTTTYGLRVSLARAVSVAS
jgi:hypothetical protein